ncbi:hypothetical protein AaE_002913, partial [Aphanomyces astaci]
DRTIVFQHDNASVHASAFTKEHLSDLGVETMAWPSKSPDLNPIENVWGVLARAVYANGHQFGSVADLKTKIALEWDRITLEYCKTLVDSMPTRMAQVILKRGAAIDY